MNGCQISQYLLFRMSDQILELERKLSRCIERLPDVGRQSTADQLFPAFCFTANTLDEYLGKEQNYTKAKYYYDLFAGEFTRYRLRILETPSSQEKFQKSNKRQILNGIVNTVQKYAYLQSQSQETERLRETARRREDEEIFERKLKALRKYYEEHNLDETCREAEELRAKIKDSAYMQEIFTHQIEEELKSYNREYQKMLELYSHFDATDGWIIDRQQQFIHNQYKVYQQQKTIAVRVTAQIDVEMLHFMVIACEIDLQKHYMPFVEISQQFKSTKCVTPRNMKIGFNLTSAPLLADRQCHFFAVGYDRIKSTGSIFIYTQSIEENKQIQDKFGYYIQDAEQKIFLKVHYFCLEFRRINNKKAQVRFVSKANFQLTFLPLFLLITSARFFAFDYFDRIVAHAKKFKGSVWQQRIKSNPTMYTFFQQKIDQYFGKN